MWMLIVVGAEFGKTKWPLKLNLLLWKAKHDRLPMVDFSSRESVPHLQIAPYMRHKYHPL